MGDAGATQRVVAHLRRSLLRGDLSPGEQLRQERIAIELNVSRVPVREALMVLANQGLLTHHPNQGFVVTKRSPHELVQVHRLLELLESELLTDFEWPDRATLMRLKTINRRMAALVEAEDWTEVVPLNHEFHSLLWRSSRLQLIADEVERVWGLADAYIAESYRSTANRASAVADHDRILEALKVRDLDLLRREHFAHSSSTNRLVSERFTPA